MKSLIEYITEGAWGYDPQQSDAVLDLRSEMIIKMIESVYDECFKMIWGGAFEEGEEIPKLNGNSAWEVVGTIEYFFEKCSALYDIHIEKGNPEYEKYYYWWKLKENHKKDIIDLYSEAISKCASDEEFINSWKEPEEMRKSLKKRAAILKKYSKFRDDYFKHQIELDKQRTDATIQHIKNPNSTVAYGKEGWVCLNTTKDEEEK